MTLNGVMAVILRYFSEIGYIPGALRKSSRSLSHLLVSFCTDWMPFLPPNQQRHSTEGSVGDLLRSAIPKVH